MNIILIVAVVALLIFFVTVLMKLTPSTETKEKTQREIEVKRPKPLQTSPIMLPNLPPTKIDVPRVTEKPVVAVGPAKIVSSVHTNQETRTPTLREDRDIAKPEKTVAPAKTESVSTKNDCQHHFGYLRTLPKNAPIPDECFGCLKVVECLVKAKTREG